MRTDINALVQKYNNKLSESKFDGCATNVRLNDKKIEKGYASINIQVKPDKAKDSVSVSIYIVERVKNIFILVVAKKNDDIIFSNFGPEAVNKSEKYILSYIERVVDKIKTSVYEKPITAA